MTTYSNPRLAARFTDWPLGGNKRGQCVFAIEHNPKRGYRFTRTTTGKPKTATYGGPAAIVDGDDGRTYLLQWATRYGFIQISKSDFMDAPDGSVFPGNPRFDELKALIMEAR